MNNLCTLFPRYLRVRGASICRTHTYFSTSPASTIDDAPVPPEQLEARKKCDPFGQNGQALPKPKVEDLLRTVDKRW